MDIIESLQNSKVKMWFSLHNKKDRDKKGLFIIEGEHLINEAIKENCIESIISDIPENYNYEKMIKVTPAIMNKLSDNSSKVHLIAICKKIEKKIIKHERLLILDGIQDPGNLGTLIRTAISFNFDGIYCSNDTCDLYNEKVIRSTQGAIFQIPIVRTAIKGIISELKKESVEIIATTLDNAKTISEIKPKNKMAFILGNEGQGVSRYLQDSADERLRIEIDGFESLNVAIAGGIIMYEYRKK